MDFYQVAEIEISYKHQGDINIRPKVIKGLDAYNILINQWDANKLDLLEQSKIILLNRANRVLGICNLSTGGIAGTVVDPRLVFVTALKANASAIILAHNHPSGNLLPSAADKQITHRLKDAGKLLEIELLDSLIITSGGYYSIVEEMAYHKIRRGNSFSLEVQPPF
ncbi:JAB domain-containing protein [Mucilaginibacter sp.]|uniref:JAB domain-containing protein n=1 Tax=Mucilaginibacter sp. TaxID=1882438 RepID=UPI0035BBC2FE